MENHFSFTSGKLKELPVSEKRYFVYDTKQPGLRLYVTPSGVKTFQFQVRSKLLGKIVSRTLGKYPSLNLDEARAQAAILLTEVNSGADIEADKRDDRRQRLIDPSVNDFFEEYIEKYAKLRKKSWQADERILKRDILPHIGSYRMKDVARRDLVAIVDIIADRGSMIMANRVHALISKFFGFAMERDVIEMSPAHGMKKRASEQSRTRILSDEEISNLWKHTGRFSSVGVLRFILITGQRPGEVRRMEWNEIHNDLWVIPAEKTKNGLAHVVPLASLALNLLENLKNNGTNSRYVFPGHNVDGNAECDCCLNETSPIHAMQKIVTALNWEVPARPHDLRRTVRSNLAKIGITQDVAERILNHKEGGISSTYNHYDYMHEKKAAMWKWNDYLSGILPKLRLKKRK